MLHVRCNKTYSDRFSYSVAEQYLLLVMYEYYGDYRTLHQ